MNMIPNSKRIQTSLHELETVSTAAYLEPATMHTHTQTRKRTYSFEIGKAKSNASEKTVQAGTFFSSTSYEQLGARQSSDKVPLLPKFEPGSSETCRFSTFLQNQQIDFAASEAELQQIVRQIQDLYLEGPIVDGWLESYPQTSQLGSQAIAYRLCGRDATGQTWSHHCPVNQLASVSVAIARYQKLQQLLERIRNS